MLSGYVCPADCAASTALNCHCGINISNRVKAGAAECERTGWTMSCLRKKLLLYAQVLLGCWLCAGLTNSW